MSKPKFDPSKAFTVVSAKAPAKPAFDPKKPFEPVESPSDEPSSMAQTFSRFARPVLEFGGATGGAVLAAPGGPVASMGGGVLGYAGGKSAADLLDRKLGIKPEVSGFGEAATETLGNIREGVITEATGQVAGAAMRPLAKLTAPAISKVAEKAKKFAVDMTPAELSKSKPLALLESALEKIPFSSGMIQRFRAKQGEQLEKAAQNLIDDLATVGTKETAGTEASQAIQNKMFKRLEVRDKLFDRLTKAVPKDSIVAVDSMRQRADDLLLRESQLPASDQNKGIIEYLKEKVKHNQTGLSFDGAKALRERLRAQIGPMADTPEKQVYKQLKDALDSDIAAFADKSGGNIERAWKKANSFHGAVKQLADDPNIKSIVDKANPGAVVDSLLRSKNTLQMRLLRKAMPEASYQKLQGAMVDRLFEGGVNQTASEALASNVKRYGDEFLEVAISKPKLERLKEFAEVVSAARGAEKMAGNPSGTAQNVITFAQGAFFIANPVKGAVAVVAPPVMAKIYLSDFGRKLIQEGVKISPQSARAAGIAGAIVSLSKKGENKSSSNSVIPAMAPSVTAMPNIPAISPVKGDAPDISATRAGMDAFLAGDRKKAKMFWERALKLNPKRLEAQRGLERISILEGREK